MTIQAVKKNRCKLNMTAVLIRCHIQFRFCLLLKQTIRSIYSRSLTRSIENLQKKNYTIHPPPPKKNQKIIHEKMNFSSMCALVFKRSVQIIKASKFSICYPSKICDWKIYGLFHYF